MIPTTLYFGDRFWRFFFLPTAAALLESDNTSQREALCNGLIARLILLRGTLNDPIPEHLAASLTVDHIPATRPRFEPESDQLADELRSVTLLL